MVTVQVAPPGRRSGSGDALTLLDRLSAPVSRSDRLTHVELLPERTATLAPWPSWVDPMVQQAFVARGVEEPWLHQVLAADAAYAGEHVAIATGTASGKSMAYLLPALTTIRESRRDRGRRGATVLYLAPTKALAADQEAAIRTLGLDVRVTTHDGDSSREQREWARDFGEYLLTNPDMLHRSMLPGHERWTTFWRSLRYVVVDEAHHYRGVFGAHVAAVLRRLRRVAASYGAEPTFVLASATMAEPEVSARRLIGADVVPVTADHSPRGRCAVALWEPPLTGALGEGGAPVRRSAAFETADLLADLVSEGVATLAFVRSRRGVEQVAATTADLLAEVDPALAGRVAAYRGGYLPEERREIERALRSGGLLGLAATNALELGIDISGLDAVLLAGFPGTRAALWQQLGRAGRRGGDALGVLISRGDPLDTYLVHHPEALFGRPVEATTFDPANPYVLAPHLCAAAQELPLTQPDLDLFGPTAAGLVDQLVAGGRLRRRPRGWFWTDRSRAADLADLRSTGGAQVQLVEAETGRVVGTVDGGRAHSTAHDGAVYVHRGESWLVQQLDLDEQVALMSPARVDYATTAREVNETRILQESAHAQLPGGRLAWGQVEVTSQVVSYLRRRVPGGEVIAEVPLDLPARTLRTTAVWWTLSDAVLDDAGLAGGDRHADIGIDLAGAAHAAEHCSIGLLPLYATCDRWDIGGLSTACHPDTGMLTVFVHDGHPGGAGFAERGFAQAPEWLAATLDTIEACECLEGCPSCVQSPKCGNQNSPLDKAGAVLMLRTLLGR